MYTPARNKQEAMRAITSADARFLQEMEIANQRDASTLAGVIRNLLRGRKKLSIFVVERVS